MNSPGGLGRARNKCENFDKIKDFITVILPGNVNLRLDHTFISGLTLWFILTALLVNTGVPVRI